MISLGVFFIPLIAVIAISLIAVLIIFIVNKKNKERLDRIVEGKESGRHSNLPEVGETIKGVSTALIIVFLFIILFSIIGSNNQLEQDNHELKQNVTELNWKVEELEEVIRENNCPYMDAQMNIVSFDEASDIATIEYSLKLKEYSSDTTAKIVYTGDKNFSVDLKNTEGSLFAGTYDINVFDMNTYEAELCITSNGVTTICKADDLTLEQIPVEMFSFYWLNDDTQFSYNNSKNEITIKGSIEITKGYGLIDNIESVYAVYRVDGVEIDRIQLDENSQNEDTYFLDVDKKIPGNNYELIIETNLTNGYSFQSKTEIHFQSESDGFSITDVAVVNPDGVVIAEF